MRKLYILFVLYPLFLFSQENGGIIANNELIAEYVNEYIQKGDELGLDLRHLVSEKVHYVLITPETKEIPNLGESNKDKKTILLSSKLLIDGLILKVILFRELSYQLGVDYDTSIIMNLKREAGFSYSMFHDEIMGIEMTRIITSIVMN